MPAETAVSNSFQDVDDDRAPSRGAWFSKSCVHGTIVHVVSTEPIGLVDRVHGGAPSAKWLAIQTCGQASYSRPVRAPFARTWPPRHSTLSPSLFSLPMNADRVVLRHVEVGVAAVVVARARRSRSSTAVTRRSTTDCRRRNVTSRRLALQVVTRHRRAGRIDLDALQLAREVLDHRAARGPDPDRRRCSRRSRRWEGPLCAGFTRRCSSTAGRPRSTRRPLRHHPVGRLPLRQPDVEVDLRSTAADCCGAGRGTSGKVSAPFT